MIANKEAGRSPIKTINGTHFLYIKHGNMYVVAVSNGNAQVAIAFQFLHEVVKVLKNYFGTFDEDSIKNNFVLIYELLDEVLDYGYPQNCSTDVLKMYITQEGNRSAAADKAASQAVTIQATGAISWRKEGIKYRKNELFIDVVENCNLMMSSKGTILRNDVSGAILVKCYLSGTPECKFGLNDKLLFDNEAKAGVRRPPRSPLLPAPPASPPPLSRRALARLRAPRPVVAHAAHAAPTFNAVCGVRAPCRAVT